MIILPNLSLATQMKGLDQFKHPTMNTLPLMLRGASKIGWYEGSGFFLIMSKSSDNSPLFFYPFCC